MFVLKFLGNLFSEHFQSGHREALVLEALTHQVLECSLSDFYVVVVNLPVGNSAQTLLLGQLHGLGVNDWLAWLTIGDSAFTVGQLYQNIDNWSAREPEQQ